MSTAAMPSGITRRSTTPWNGSIACSAIAATTRSIAGVSSPGAGRGGAPRAASQRSAVACGHQSFPRAWGVR
jgi:hypothetical protein